MQLIVNGGAGGELDHSEARQTVLDEAATTEANEATPIEAVVGAVRMLESNPCMEQLKP